MTAHFSRAHRQTRLTDRPLLWGFCSVLAGLLFTALLLLLGAAAAYSQREPSLWILPVSLLSVCSGALICGFFAGRCSLTPILCGLGSGGALVLLMTLLSFLPLGDSHTALPILGTLLIRLGMLGCTVLGSFMSRKRKPHPRQLFKTRRR